MFTGDIFPILRWVAYSPILQLILGLFKAWALSSEFCCYFIESMTISNSVQFTILHHYVGDLDCLTLFAYMYIQPRSNLKRSCSVFCNQTCNPTQDWCSLALLVDNLIVSYQNGGNFFPVTVDCSDWSEQLAI